MSYTRSFSSSVSYSGSVPVTFNILVDTDPFDNSIANENSHVDRLTGAVVAMNASQVASVKKSGDAISDAILSGFYKLIGSEITTQMSENKSILQSKIALVMQLAKDIEINIPEWKRI